MPRKALDAKKEELSLLLDSQIYLKKELDEEKEEVKVIINQKAILGREFVEENMALIDGLITSAKHWFEKAVEKNTFFDPIVNLNL